MKLYTSLYYSISVSTTKTLFKFKNNKTGNEIKISVNDLKKAYGISLKDTHINTQVALFRTLYFLDKNLNDLKEDIKSDKNRLKSIERLKSVAEQFEKEYFHNYSYRSLFKELFFI